MSSGNTLERTPNLGISLTLPDLYNDVLDKFENFICKVLIDTSSLSNYCAIYENEILLEDLSL